MQESDKIRDSVRSYLEGKSVLDLGCGLSRVVPWAIGADDWSEHSGHAPEPGMIKARIDPDDTGLERALDGRKFSVVFSSHALEHMRTPILETLHHWLSFVEPGGRLILYLPDERYYIYNHGNPIARNPAHKHFLTWDTFLWYVQQISYTVIEENRLDVGQDRYSFLVILRKK